MGWNKDLYTRHEMNRRAGGVSVGIKFSMFFDRQTVIDLIGKAEAKVLGWQGGTVRKIAQYSIKRKGYGRAEPVREKAKARWLEEVHKQPASPAGTPPYTHGGRFSLREDIVYAFDPSTHSAVIGPWQCPWLNALHEQGGDLPVTEYRTGGGRFFWRRSASRAPRGAVPTGAQSVAHYPSRSFMKRALNVAKEQLPQLWRGTVTAAA